MYPDTDRSHPSEIVQPALAPILVLNGQMYVIPGSLHLFPGRPCDRISAGRPSDGTSHDVRPDQMTLSGDLR
jgi:hypothetical protein